MSRLTNFFAPYSTVEAANLAAGGSRTFYYGDRGSHATLNAVGGSCIAGCRGGGKSADDEPASDDELIVPGGAEARQHGDAFVADINGVKRVYTSKIGKVLYFGCGRLIRRILHNPVLFFSKTFVSFIIFYSAWYTMHLGGAMATMRFPRPGQTETTEKLPDILMDYFGEPLEIKVNGFRLCGHKDDNWYPGADFGLTLNLFLTLLEAFSGRHGHVHLQRALHMSALVFLIRATVVGLTGLNNPNTNERCLNLQDTEMTYLEALKFVMSSFPHRSCGDLIYSGHTALLSLWMLNMEWQNGIVRTTWWIRLACLAFSFWGIFLLIICRSHYTVDIALGFYFAYFVSEFYYVRSLNLYQGTSFIGSTIQRLEYWGEDWEKAGAIGKEDVEEDDARTKIREKMKRTENAEYIERDNRDSAL